MLDNKYPSYQEAVSILEQHWEGSIAFSKTLSLRKTKTGIIELYLKNDNIGYMVKGGKLSIPYIDGMSILQLELEKKGIEFETIY